MFSWLQLRPTFEIPLDLTRDQAVAQIGQAYERGGRDLLMLVHGEYCELHLPESEHRLWSPHLSFHVHERSGQVVLLCRYAPRVNVWTVVWIFYLLFAFMAFFGITIGCSQWSAGVYAWGWWVVAASLLALGGLYLVASIGQQWSADQMHRLRQQLEAFLATARIGLPHQTR